MPRLPGDRGVVLLATIASALITGCALNGNHGPRLTAVETDHRPEFAARTDLVRSDPVGYLREVAERCRNLEQYTLTFTREERRGFLQTLQGPERIACWFRRKPFGVRMKWLDPDVKYGESVYVEGQKSNKVRFTPRSGLFGSPATVTVVDLQTPVIWGESKRPLTDFGLQRLMERTLAPLTESGPRARVTYRGIVTLEHTGQVVHHLHLEYPASRYRVPLQDLYIDVATDLPAGTVLRLPTGRLDAAYFYQDINPNVRLTDEDFLLDAERRPTARAAAGQVPPS